MKVSAAAVKPATLVKPAHPRTYFKNTKAILSQNAVKSTSYINNIPNLSSISPHT